MKLIESKVEVIEQQPGLEGVYKQIELAGRTCYKSEDKITEDSAKEFVDRMIKSKHGAMLEHGTVYLKITYPISSTLSREEFEKYVDEHHFEYELGKMLCDDKYTKARARTDDTYCTWYITTNMRVLCTDTYDSLPWRDYVCEPTEHHEKRVTARFTCDRGVSHEIVRHRVMSFAQESTRYCNYSKDKFGCELTFIRPSWYDKTLENKHGGFEKFLEDAQSLYIALLDQGYLPQEARACLPNALKTEIVVTGFESDWEHFFELRTVGAAHPDIRKLALELQEKLNSVNK